MNPVLLGAAFPGVLIAKYIADRVAECERDIRKAEALIAQVKS